MNMKILQIGSLPPEVGGQTKGGLASHVWDLSRNLAKRGHEVCVIADNLPYKKIPEVTEGVIIYGCHRLSPKHILPLICENAKKILKLWGYIDKKDVGLLIKSLFYKQVFNYFKPDIIHVHGQANRFPPAYYINDENIPIVVTIHGISTMEYSFPDRWAWFIKKTKKNVELINNLIFVSKFVESEFKQYIGAFKGSSWVIYNPIDTTKFYPINKEEARVKLNLPLDVPIILFVGSLSKRKGEFTLLGAVKMFKEKEINLKVIIIGNGPELNSVKHYIIKNELNNMVTILKSVSHSELLLYYNAADLFVMPSLSEAFALAYIEAMLCGVPAIGTEGVANESIPSEDYGFLVPSGNSKSLAVAIEQGLKKRWNKGKIIKYAQTFSWKKRIEEFESVYKEILKKHGGGLNG